MRIRDILKENVNVKLSGPPSKVDPDFSAVSPGMISFRELRNTDPYMQYRLGIAIAATMHDDTDFEQETAYAENMIFVTYTPAEEELILKAAKLMGVTPTQVAPMGSTEEKDVGKKSLFAKK